MASKKSKAGRPPGSTNHAYLPVEEIPAACPKCRGTNLTKVEGSKVLTRTIRGKLPSGATYNRADWIKKICDCKQRLVVIAYYQVEEAPAPAENKNPFPILTREIRSARPARRP